MKVVVLASRKGGSGKTTLAGHLAVQAERAGAGPVALIDTDPQGSLAGWWNERRSEAPGFVTTTLAQLPSDLERLRTILPHLSSPTVMPLADDGEIAIHSAVPAKDVWEVMEELRNNGARDILAVPVEVMVR